MQDSCSFARFPLIFLFVWKTEKIFFSLLFLHQTCGNGNSTAHANSEYRLICKNADDNRPRRKTQNTKNRLLPGCVFLHDDAENRNSTGKADSNHILLRIICQSTENESPCRDTQNRQDRLFQSSVSHAKPPVVFIVKIQIGFLIMKLEHFRLSRQTGLSDSFLFCGTSAMCLRNYVSANNWFALRPRGPILSVLNESMQSSRRGIFNSLSISSKKSPDTP